MTEVQTFSLKSRIFSGSLYLSGLINEKASLVKLLKDISFLCFEKLKAKECCCSSLGDYLFASPFQ